MKFITFIFQLIATWGRYSLSKKEIDYPPSPFPGTWVDRGKGTNEEWHWVEKNKKHKMRYANVFKTAEEAYTILISEEISNYAVEWVDCADDREVEIALSLLTSQYEVLGNVSYE